MTSALLSRRRVLVAASCAVSLDGCSVLPNPPVAQIYRLSSLPDEPTNGTSLHKRLIIDVPTASESLDTDRIALIRNRTRFDYYANVIWTDRVPVLLQGMLVAAFENDGRIAEVGLDASALTPDYVLETEIRAFEARYSGSGDQPPEVAVALVLSLVGMPDREMAGQTQISATAPAAGNNLDSIVEAFDVVVDKTMSRSVAWTVRTMGQVRDQV